MPDQLATDDRKAANDDDRADKSRERDALAE